MSSEDALVGASRLLLDTGPTIYAVERHPKFLAPTQAILSAAFDLGVRVVVSSVTYAEALSKPNATAEELQRYAKFCLSTEGIEFREILFDEAFAILVARLRRTTNLKLPDCIQLASAETLGCDAVLTNDRQLSRGPRRVIQVEDIDL